MLRGIGKVASAVIDGLLPGTKAEACTVGWCERRAGRNQHRCCRFCPVKTCTPWRTGTCVGVDCIGS